MSFELLGEMKSCSVLRMERSSRARRRRKVLRNVKRRDRKTPKMRQLRQKYKDKSKAPRSRNELVQFRNTDKSSRFFDL